MALFFEGLFASVGRSLRATGRVFDQFGASLQGDLAFTEQLSRHRRLVPFAGVKPSIGNEVFIAPNAAVVGNVTIGKHSSIWYGATLRGDVNEISVGSNTSIGDNSVISASEKEGASPTSIGNYVTIGNGATIHGSTLQDYSSVEMGAVLHPNVVVEGKSIVSAGAVVPEGTLIPSGELWGGSPAHFVRKLTEEEQNSTQIAGEKWKTLAEKHSNEHQKTSHERFVEDLESEFAADSPPPNPHEQQEVDLTTALRAHSQKPSS
mmetsp:Transcript_11611/g.15450  ORF Transcript_11611/g.15450 Transcript_11611/m.15450 type:complete len:263 (+) Transcript_11611:74-862(+)|eukprot:CAMPEP_0201488748 /NCGR_PEP_ID=MMETSP0151_2-20130828/19358_1 /ASSEMBLY_ACC=CAM_ASM_000257 /TAXON_ID=200890 /ORGANISM="Paramoeba atlantica, Strain 621/1 / CCAP 1560/9" /LENGTH=262 /DNA_ID=CAMNT_0047874103 /DNA_START=68 /DNA_END=856 /DNA_ORIENTATION=+